MMRVVLADDHGLVRAGIRSVLERMPDVEIVGEASDGAQALQIVSERKTDLVLMDIAMPVMNGLDVAAEIAKEVPETKVLILSMHDDDEYVVQALRRGVVGYLLKDAAAAELEVAVGAISRGETYLSPAISRKVIDGYLARSTSAGDQALTPRQTEVLKLIARGMSTKQVASTLKLSVKTVESHRTVLMERLGIRDLAGLVRYAIRSGLITSEV